MFAAISNASAGATLPLITSAVASFIKLYLLLLFVRVLLTWFPNVDWMGQPWVTLRQVTDPYLNLFRNLIPPLMGQIDFTPICLNRRERGGGLTRSHARAPPPPQLASWFCSSWCRCWAPTTSTREPRK